MKCKSGWWNPEKNMLIWCNKRYILNIYIYIYDTITVYHIIYVPTVFILHSIDPQKKHSTHFLRHLGPRQGGHLDVRRTLEHRRYPKVEEQEMSWDNGINLGKYLNISINGLVFTGKSSPETIDFPKKNMGFSGSNFPSNLICHPEKLRTF